MYLTELRFSGLRHGEQRHFIYVYILIGMLANVGYTAGFDSIGIYYFIFASNGFAYHNILIINYHYNFGHDVKMNMKISIS